MTIKFDRKTSQFVVGRKTKAERFFVLFRSAEAYRDAMRDMKESGVL